MRFTGAHIVVMGAGKSGLAATRLLLKHGAHVMLYDDKESRLKLLDGELSDHEHLTLHCGPNSLLLDESIAAAVLSPGIDSLHPLVQHIIAQKIPLYNEIDLALEVLPPHTIIGITGTNGKSTTTVMMESILIAAGVKAIACGNLGTPLCELALLPFDYEMIVLELSSFQLEALQKIKLAGALIVNITPDHLDRYDSFDSYQQAKLKIASLLTQNGVLVLHESLTHHLLDLEDTLERRPFSGQQFGKGEYGFLSEAKIYGEHNKENAVGAATLALALGIHRNAIIQGLNSFNPLPHRCEVVAEKYGITFINDSKGTTVVAVEKALSMFQKPTHLLLGGIEKGEDFGALSPHNFPQVQGYYVYGQAKHKIMGELNSDRAHIFSDLTQAFQKALRNASPGDIILLSPGCASYDQFDNYQHRGECFRDLVKKSSKESSCASS